MSRSPSGGSAAPSPSDLGKNNPSTATSGRKLNFGCGARFADSWVNIDFHSNDPRVQRVNLLNRFPFDSESFDAVYSSHVLEHFTQAQGRFLIGEAHRVLRKGGVLRIVVPDLEASCREYLRVLSLPEGDRKEQLYRWIIIELLDQMVRRVPSGQMKPLVDEIMSGEDEALKRYLHSRTQNTPWTPPEAPLSLGAKLRRLTVQKLATKVSYGYLAVATRLIPRSLRDLVLVRTTIGECHRWMYDGYSLARLFREAGFREVRRVEYNQSRIAGFNRDCLDCHADGTTYKYNSIYMEGVR
ncbi:MAG TPA: methyltransferase domain-containing protein [Chthoniobacteraceae bacterium]|nr:methyltransferase domain-containing protein [Chthoniobacteraceae bacterium]